MYDSIICSDLHLGSRISAAKDIFHFIHDIRKERIQTKELILAGDVFDSLNLQRFKKNHWKVLSEIRKLSKHIPVHWIGGNHDGPVEFIGNMLGVDVQQEYTFTSGNKKVIIVHGHIFDNIVNDNPEMTNIASGIYNLAQRWTKLHNFIIAIKQKSKVFMRSIEQVRNKALIFAQDKECDIICCGHTHNAEIYEGNNGIQYCNCGCWTGNNREYITIKCGLAELHKYDKNSDHN